ncbi:flagellar export protein FliJ [Cellulosilyticum sp. WCF-2]|uniref:flagellar export protein FliJ n=1 Tax=Cellulosilyticum sp. WCF-2 TaxID=2497860 RepID=UPI000F8CF91D|nr:flagellar export protein FliJ [Cellulosilyticum sp. WCF-2]QEH69609.1 flagellar export protein FliJ [Cellulosilyticum sp. WCF-2]
MFKYKLEPILALKEKLEESKKRELGLAHQCHEKAKAEKEVLVKQREMAYKEAKIQSHEKVNIIQLRQLNYYSNYMEEAIHSKNEEIDLAAKKVEQRREELVEAVKERKILENLKELQLEDYKEEEKRKENNVVDEIVTYKYRANQKE